MMKTLRKRRASIIAACSLADVEKSWQAGMEFEIYRISQAENRMPGRKAR